MATPSEAHLLAFGRILHNYASVETGIQISLSAILGIGLGDASIAFQPYTASSLRNVAKSLAKERLKPKLAEQLCCIVGDWFHYNGVRNLIAHTRWTEGARPGALKPRGVSIREGRARWLGGDPDEQDFTATELEQVAHELHKINERVKQFLVTSGLGPIIEAKIASR